MISLAHELFMNEHYTANRASEAEEQMKERLRIRREKKNTRGKEKVVRNRRLQETEDHEKQIEH